MRGDLQKRFDSIRSLNKSYITFDEFEWGWDMMRTRAIQMDSTIYRYRITMYPLFDLALHGDLKNLRNDWDIVPGAMTWTAWRRIHIGDEFLISYRSLGGVLGPIGGQEPTRASLGAVLA